LKALTVELLSVLLHCYFILDDIVQVRVERVLEVAAVLFALMQVILRAGHVNGIALLVSAAVGLVDIRD